MRAAIGAVRRRVRDVSRAAYFHLVDGFDPAGLDQLNLYDFSRVEEIARFEIATDRAIGGGTVCSFGIKEDATAGRRAVFEGIVDCDDPIFAAVGGQNAGYATFRTVSEERPPFLAAFSGLEMRVRTDGRPYLVVLRCDGEAEDDWDVAVQRVRATHAETLYQAELVTSPGRWVTVGAAFDQFIRVSRGAVRLDQARFSAPADRMVSGVDPATIRSFGVTLADGVNGPFRFEIQDVTAIRHYDPSKYQSRVSGTRLRKRLLKGAARPQAIGPSSHR